MLSARVACCTATDDAPWTVELETKTKNKNKNSREIPGSDSLSRSLTVITPNPIPLQRAAADDTAPAPLTPEALRI